MVNVQSLEDNILIIDCDSHMLNELRSILSDKVESVILSANNMDEGLQLLQEENIAVIVCDHILPGLNGIECLKKAHLYSPETICMLLADEQNDPQILKAISEGEMVYCFNRSSVGTVFLPVVKRFLEQYRALKEYQRLQQLVFDQHQEILKHFQVQKNGLALSKSFHEEILKGKVPHDHRSLEISAASVASTGVDSDFFEFSFPARNLVDIIVGDVMGKGLPATLIATAVKNQLLRFTQYTRPVYLYRKGEIWGEDLFSPSEIVSLINKNLGKFLHELGFFASILYGRFNLETQTFNYVNAGLPAFLHYQHQKKQLKEIHDVSIPMGIDEHEEYVTSSLEVEEGDLLIFPSNGVVEAHSAAGKTFEFSKLTDLILTHCEASTENIVTAVRQAVEAQLETKEFVDDFTFVVVKVKELFTQNYQEDLAKFACDLSQLKAVRSFASKMCQKAPGDQDSLCTQIQLLISEVFSNLVQHAFPDRHRPIRETVIVVSSLEKEGIRFQISDQGVALDPSKIKEPALSGEEESGFGWYMIRAIADELTYIPKSNPKGWNHLHVFKKYFKKRDAMNLKHTLKDNILIITPEFENLDTKNAGDFKDQVIDLITTYGNQKVIFDLHQLQFVDSSGLGSFLSILKVLNKQGGDLKLSCLNRSTQATLEVVSLHKIFEIFPKNDDAIRSFK